MSRKKAGSILILLLEIILSLGFLSLIVQICIYTYTSERWKDAIIALTPQAIILISAIVSQIILVARHRALSQEGNLIPILFLFIILQNITLLPIFYQVTGWMILPPAAILALGRFSILTAAVLFVFSSILYYGTNMSRIWLYIAFSIGCCAFISIIIPSNTNIWVSKISISTSYDAYLHIAVIMLLAAGALTYLVATIKDRATHKITRALSFILLMAGNYISLAASIVPAAISSVLFIAGTVLLVTSSKDTF
ncbi:MAG: hypothetical protein SPJ34_01095 [Candidatus Ornithospirochaeta sp.]|nr:hypothetical protein [Candidatus Ornithospirochaeta sp.]